MTSPMNYVTSNGEIPSLFSKVCIWELPIEEQAKYADDIPKFYINNDDFHRNQLSFDKRRNYEIWDDIAIGNLAYLSLNAPEEYRLSYGDLLDDYIVWKRNETSFCLIL
jgi:hypothetical protein